MKIINNHVSNYFNFRIPTHNFNKKMNIHVHIHINNFNMIKIYTKIYRKLLYNTKLKMLRFIINKLDDIIWYNKVNQKKRAI